MRIKFTVTVLVAFVLFSGVLYMFYQAEIKDSLPTPIPSGFVKKEFGIKLSDTTNKKLKLIHFFNPNCPCSRFNLKHLEKIVNKYTSDIEILAYSTDSSTSIDFPINIIYDKNGEMAKHYGVYSTPQAVLLNQHGKLIFRGNYNKSRFCGNSKSEFVVQAIENALKQKNTFEIMQKSGKPYGCSIYN